MVKITTIIQKKGNALSLYLPSTIAKEMKIQKGDPVMMDIVDGKIIIETV